MVQLAGAYLEPNIVISPTFTYENLSQVEFWNTVKKDWGEIVVEINHKSTTRLRRESNPKYTYTSEKSIYLTQDGLISTEVPDDLESQVEAISVIASHISSFLGVLNLGGLFLYTVCENHVFLAERVNNIIMQCEGSGDRFMDTINNRSKNRFTVPLDIGDYLASNGKAQNIRAYESCPFLRTPDEIAAFYEHGNTIQETVQLSSDALVLENDALESFTLRKFNSSLLHGWSFIEMVLDTIWRKEILSNVTGERKDRLKDNRTYSSAVKLELLLQRELLSQELYDYLNHLRKLRNDLIHSSVRVNKVDIELMFPKTNELLSLLTDKNPGINRQGGAVPGTWIKGYD